MAEYKFYVDDFSLRTTWKRMVQSAGIVGYDIVAGTATKEFPISGIVLNEGEFIQKVVLTSVITKYGTSTQGISITVNGINFGGTRKFDTEGVENDSTWEAKFVVTTSGSYGQAGALNQSVSHNCTVTFSNVTLTITTGATKDFDGKVSSMNEGDKILIEESEGVFASYTLVHHEYNTGKALLFRDESIGTKQWRSSVPSSADANRYKNSTLDNYLENTWFPSLLETTRSYLQTIDYPVADTDGTSILISRNAATLSGSETGEGGNTDQYGNLWNYTGTLNQGTTGSASRYWTRESVGGMANMARSIWVGTSATLASNTVVTYLDMRPTIGVLEDQFVIYSETDNAYLFGSPHNAPTNLYINGEAEDVEGLNSEANLTLSWEAATAGDNGLAIGGYAVWYSPSADEEFQIYGTTTETSMTIIGPKKGRQSYYFKVQTLAPEGMEYCDSELSAAVRIAATKNSNVYYYNGYAWRIASPKSYGENGWIIANGGKYYNGVAWVPIIAVAGEVATLDSATLDNVVLG